MGAEPAVRQPAGRAEGHVLPSPRLGYLLKEFLGFHDPSDLYLYVTDGGHWENTALVELLRTGLHREIVCIDADSGAGYRVASLSKAIDLAKLECNATVMVNLDTLRADRDPYPGQDYSPRSVTLGIVHRQVRHPDPPVTEAGHHFTLLWYCKPALTQDMPPKLLAYREIDETFPRVNTVNQFFHIAQFAAYRDLGRYNAGQIQVARERLRDAVSPHLAYPDFRASVLDGEAGRGRLGAGRAGGPDRQAGAGPSGDAADRLRPGGLRRGARHAAARSMSAVMVARVEVEDFNHLADDDAEQLVGGCLGVQRWVDEVVGGRPYADTEALHRQAHDAALDLSDEELGSALRDTHGSASVRATRRAPRRSTPGPSSPGCRDEDAERLREGNATYEARFGHVFLIRAAGRGGAEILAELEGRLGHDEAAERESRP